MEYDKREIVPTSRGVYGRNRTGAVAKGVGDGREQTRGSIFRGDPAIDRICKLGKVLSLVFLLAVTSRFSREILRLTVGFISAVVPATPGIYSARCWKLFDRVRTSRMA